MAILGLRITLSAYQQLLEDIGQLLSKDGMLSPKKDLWDFLEWVECTIEALFANVRFEHLQETYLNVLGPVVLGKPIWHLFKRAGHRI